eukprot:349855-Chlamydomonas_euryale.AAC.12
MALATHALAVVDCAQMSTPPSPPPPPSPTPTLRFHGDATLKCLPLLSATRPHLPTPLQPCPLVLRHPRSYFMPITLGVLLLVYVLAVSMASVWSVIGFVGGITSTGATRAA